MSKREELLALAERVEAATGPDTVLDERIGMAIGLKRTVRVGHECLGNDRVVPVMCPRYTASLDAAMGLVPEGLTWMCDNFDGIAGGPSGSVFVDNKWHDAGRKTASPALALAAAALRARAAMETGNG